MTEIYELTGRELDPVYDVQRQFERHFTNGSYLDPYNGDYISDEYLLIVDLTTQPDEFTETQAGDLNESITRLNVQYPYIQKMLGGSSLLGAYTEVVEQVNTINSADHSRRDIIRMHAAPIEVIPEINENINRAKWLMRMGMETQATSHNDLQDSAALYFDEAEQCYDHALELGSAAGSTI